MTAPPIAGRMRPQAVRNPLPCKENGIGRRFSQRSVTPSGALPHSCRELDYKGRRKRPKSHHPEGFAMRKLIVLTAAAAALLVSACNTISGVGKDAQAAGRAVSGAAENAKK